MKKILSVVVVFVLLVAMSVSAFAAAPTTAQNENGSWTTAGEDAAYANSMMTILAYTEGQAISVDSIQYIDQTTADSNGAYAFANYLPKVDPTTAKYVVLIGGQKIAEPLAAGYIEVKANDMTITGVIAKEGNQTAATVELLDGETLVKSVAADATTGEFSITAPVGVYTLKITKPAHTSYTYYKIDSTVATVEATLFAGNCDGQAGVDVNDITPLIANLGEAKSEEAANIDCDVTDDGAIDVNDITPLIANLGELAVEVNKAE